MSTNLQRKQLGDQLSPRQLHIVQLASEGHADPAIAQALNISVHTVRDYWRYAIRLALGAKDRTHAVALAVKQGLADPTPRGQS